MYFLWLSDAKWWVCEVDLVFWVREPYDGSGGTGAPLRQGVALLPPAVHTQHTHTYTPTHVHTFKSAHINL